MRYHVTQPFIAFGMTPQPGDIVELTPEQAKILLEMNSVTDYETKVLPLPDEMRKKKRSELSLQARRHVRRTLKSCKHIVTK